MVSRDELIAYLLHEMPQAERDSFAEQWFADPDLHHELEMAEAELLDSYARSQVSRMERRRIERYLLGSDAQRRKLAFAEALAITFPGRARAWTRWGFIAAAIAVLLLGNVWIWRVKLENRRLRTEVARVRQVAPAIAGGVYAVPLASDALRGSMPENSLRLPQHIAILRLDLEREPEEENENYSVTVLAVGQVVWTESPVRPEKRGEASVVPVWIPANVLASGRYTVKLQTGGALAAYYSFRIAP